MEMVSVIVPAYNAEHTLAEQLEALTRQTYEGEWEVIVSDDASTDSTRAVAEGFADRLPELTVVGSTDRGGAAVARNRGARVARGNVLAFCDADDRVDEGWLAALAAAAADHGFVTGAIDHESLNLGLGASHWRSHVRSLPLALRFKPFALSGNMAVSQEVFTEVGGFPEDLDSVGEDVAFSWSAQLAGHALHFEPAAVVAYRHRGDLRTLWRQHRAFGLADAVLYKRFRRHGVPRPRLRSVLAAYGRLVLRLPFLLSSQRRPAVIRGLAQHWGRVVGSFRERVFYP